MITLTLDGLVAVVGLSALGGYIAAQIVDVLADRYGDDD